MEGNTNEMGMLIILTPKSLLHVSQGKRKFGKNNWHDNGVEGRYEECKALSFMPFSTQLK